MASVAAKLKKQKWLSNAFNGEMKTDGDIKNTAIKTTVETVLSVLVGGAIGSSVGRPSFLLGLGATATGHYMGIKWLAPIGIGMMASSNPMGIDKPVSGFDIEGVKDRLVSFKDSLLHRTYLDKVFKKANGSANRTIEAPSEEEVNGIGDLGFHRRALRDVENQLVRSAMDFKRSRGESTEGIEDDEQCTDEPDFSGF